MFINENSSIDREALRTYVLGQLCLLKQSATEILLGENTQKFWKDVHDSIVTSQETDKDSYLTLENQLCNLPKFIDQWIQTAVDSPERLEFFVASKAEEVKSGDQMKDYFWAMQIRHDQLIAVVRVISRLLETMNEWTKKPPSVIMFDPIFQGLLDYDLEAQIYLEAEHIHKERSDIVKHR